MEIKYQDKNIINIIIRTKAVPKGRPRLGRGVVYTPKKTKDFENIIRLAAKREMINKKIFTEAVSAKITFYFKGKKKDIGLPKTTRGDLDNHTKAIFDALNEIVFVDDAQVSILLCSKVWDIEDRIEIEIKEYGPTM